MRTEEQSLEYLYSLKEEYTNNLNYVNYEIENHTLEIKKQIEKRFSLCKKVTQEEHPTLFDVFSSINKVKYVEGEVDTYKTPIPYYGLEVTLDNVLYTVVFQSDSDYAWTIYDYCIGNEPKITRSSSNLMDCSTLSNSLYELMENNASEIENFILEIKEGNPNNYKIIFLTAYYCASQM